MLEYKIERDSTTTKNCVFDLTPSEKEWWINKLSYFRLKKELENNYLSHCFVENANFTVKPLAHYIISGLKKWLQWKTLFLKSMSIFEFFVIVLFIAVVLFFVFANLFCFHRDRLFNCCDFFNRCECFFLFLLVMTVFNCWESFF